MPKLSLVICVNQQRELLDRLLRNTAKDCDDILIIHDGPDESGIGELAQSYQARFLEAPRRHTQEPHWPAAWAAAQHDWILRLDADEVPSEELRGWLRNFRASAEPDDSISGYTCIWPLWDGHRMITKHWPAGRLFLLHKQRVQFFGMAEQTPVADSRFEPVGKVLEHRPGRKSYGLSNLLLRRQAYRWRELIAQSLLGRPTDLPTWRWTQPDWPVVWEEIRRRPIRTAFVRLFVWPLRSLRDFWRHEHKLLPLAAVSGGLHHCLIALAYWRARRLVAKND